jgi:hypothetical protein
VTEEALTEMGALAAITGKAAWTPRATLGPTARGVAPAGTAPTMAPANTIETVTAVTTTPRQRTTAPIENTGFTYSQEWTDDLTDRSATPPEDSQNQNRGPVDFTKS